MSALIDEQARTDLLHRLRRAEGQLRGIQRMLENEEDCQLIGRQFSAVRKALDSTYLRMTMCFVTQEMETHAKNSDSTDRQMALMLKEMETMLRRIA